jgi:hypothetical protein
MPSKLPFLLCAILVACSTETVSAKAEQSPPLHRPVVVSPTHPTDSQGEVVYDLQDAAQGDAHVVPGTLIFPEMLTKVRPRIPMSTRLHHRKINILIEAVVTAKGDVIDAHVLQGDY